MSLFDWVEAGSDIAGAADPGNSFTEWMEKYFPGSYTVTMGDSLNSLILGGQQYHVYGDNIQFTVDWEGIIENALGIHGYLATVIGGGSGAMNFVYGHNATAIYGPNMTVQRGPAYSVTGVNPLFKTGLHGLAPPVGSDQADIDKTAAVLIGVLSAIMILVGLVLEVLASIYCFVPLQTPPDSPPPPPGSPPPPPPTLSGPAQKYKEASGLISWGLTNRIMGVILLLEQTSKDLRSGIGRTPDIGQKAEDAEKAIAKLNTTLDAFAANAVDGGLGTTDDAANAIKQATADIAQLVLAVAGVKGTADTAVQTANFSNLMLQEWNVISAGKVQLISSGNNLGVEMTATGTNSPISLSSATAVNLSSGVAQMALDNNGVNGHITMDIGASGSIAAQAGAKDIGSNLWLGTTGITAQFGAPLVGSIIKLSEESIKLSVDETTYIELTPLGITLMVDEVMFKMTAAGIFEEVTEVTREVTAEGHNFMAAEAEMNFGVEGLTVETPTAEEEYEAATEINITLQNLSVDSVATLEIVLTVLE